MDSDYHELIFRAVDQTISPADFDRLQDRIQQDDDVRSAYLRAVHLSESLREIAAEESSGPSSTPNNIAAATGVSPDSQPERPRRDLRWPLMLTTTIAIVAVVGSVAYRFGQQALPPNAAGASTQQESLIAGHATLSRSVDVTWPAGARAYRDGDMLPDGLLLFDAGVAEIDFFCGATLIVEGPAVLNLESDWSVRVLKGRLRASVPPAARGFIVKAADSEIIDLGTEFALDVGEDHTAVQVIDGEVKLRGGEFDGNHLVTGQGQLLQGIAAPNTFAGLSTLHDIQRRQGDAATVRFNAWQSHAKRLSADSRLIAYFPIADSITGRVISNTAATSRDRDGQIVGPVNVTAGRFGEESTGLEFDRLGSRVRTRIDGTFSALTLACWVRIDSLDHVYNALFMSDGYENGEPHWQIREDGRLMLSVMVNDAQNIQHFSKHEQKVVKANGLARVYYTEPIWDPSKSGQWFHIAAVYDPARRRVSQYVNGKRLSNDVIEDKFYIETLKIGPAEIGNWGQPFRKTPWFSVRNMNGTIDELAVFNAAISSEEITELYEQGKPLGY